MRLPFSQGTGRRLRLVALSLALLAAAVAALLAPPLVLPALATVALLLLLDRIALARDLRALAAALASTGPDVKLEVTEGAWGELAHALNRLRQQRRTQEQIRNLLPVLPAAPAARLADGGHPAEGVTYEVAALAMSLAGGPAAPAARLRELGAAALPLAERHDALLVRAGERLVLVFGAMGSQSPATTLRAAEQSARILAGHWPVKAEGRLRLTLAYGRAHAIVLPGLGYTVLGPPLDQALLLQSLTTPGRLLCNEDAYLGLRRLGLVPPQSPVPRLPAPDERPVYAIGL